MTKTEFDNLLRRAYLDDCGENPFGYPSGESQSNYPNYFSAEAFQVFVREMQEFYPNAYRKYAAGKGSELVPSHNAPPKMASIASSSRFCYLALRNGARVLGADTVAFEHECRIRGIVGTAPQMDAYSAEGNIFIEVKCHEIFDEHNICLSQQYYSWLCEYPNGFRLALPKPEAKDKISIPLSAFGLGKNCMFDVKQFLCHLMGIASTSNRQPSTLIYLFFKPRLADPISQNQVDEVFSKLTDEIRLLFTSPPVASFCKANQITLRAVAQFAPVMQALSPRNIISLY